MTRRPSRQDTWPPVRIRPELHERLRAEAEARDLSMQWLLDKALTQFLNNLIPVDEFRLTRPPDERAAERAAEGAQLERMLGGMARVQAANYDAGR